MGVESAPSSEVPNETGGSCPRAEQAIAGTVLLCIIAFRVVYCFRLQVDSDEPQHLHVAWLWSQGMVAYRDFFDNHTPLFHILLAPVLAWIGERDDIINIGRLFMLAPLLLALWAIHRLGRTLFSERVALWAPVLAGAFPGHLFPSIEFRADNLWAAVWLAALAVLLTCRPSPAQIFAAALLGGSALALSMKTGLLLVALAAAALGAAILAASTPTGTHRARAAPARPARCAVAGLAGFLVMPGWLLAFFARQGSLARMKYCILDHNLLPPGITVQNRQASWLLLAFALPCLVVAARGFFHRAVDRGISFRRSALFLHAAFVASVLAFAWPVHTRQNGLPVYPLIALFLSVPLIAMAEKLASRLHWSSPAPALAGGIALILGGAAVVRPIATDSTQPAKELIHEALALTNPGEPVFTYKGEAVFRPRPYSYVLETITCARLEHGLLPDDIASHLLATGTCVTMAQDHRLPHAARRFIEQNYLPVGRLCVAGRELPPPDHAGHIHFEIDIPAEYTLVLQHGFVVGAKLDGLPFGTSAFVTAGAHDLELPADTPGATLLWTRAVQRGFRVVAHHTHHA